MLCSKKIRLVYSMCSSSLIQPKHRLQILDAYSYCKVLSGFNVINSPATATLNISILGLEIFIYQEFNLALSQLHLINSNIGELILELSQQPLLIFKCHITSFRNNSNSQRLLTISAF